MWCINLSVDYFCNVFTCRLYQTLQGFALIVERAMFKMPQNNNKFNDKGLK